MYEIAVTRRFSAAHKLLGYPGDCARLHGHSWVVEAAVRGPGVNELGMLVDFSEIKNMISRVISDLDHNCLNELSVFDGSEPLKNPTAENISRYIYRNLQDKISSFSNVKLARVTVWESADASATYWEEEN